MFFKSDLIKLERKIKRVKHQLKKETCNQNIWKYGEENEPKLKREHTCLFELAPIETDSRKEKIKEMAGTTRLTEATRNKRLFCSLQGTLQSHQRELKKAKESHQGRQQIEKKVDEELAAQTKAASYQQKVEKKVIFQFREEYKQRWLNLKVKELMLLEKKQEVTEAFDRKIKRFMAMSLSIKTEIKPPIFFKPAVHCDESLKKLNLTKDLLLAPIDSIHLACREVLENIDKKSLKFKSSEATIQNEAKASLLASSSSYSNHQSSSSGYSSSISAEDSKIS